MKQHYLTTDYQLCADLIKTQGTDKVKDLVGKYTDAVRSSIYWQKEAEELKTMLNIASAENTLLKKELNK